MGGEEISKSLYASIYIQLRINNPEPARKLVQSFEVTSTTGRASSNLYPVVALVILDREDLPPYSGTIVTFMHDKSLRPKIIRVTGKSIVTFLARYFQPVKVNASHRLLSSILGHNRFYESIFAHQIMVTSLID